MGLLNPLQYSLLQAPAIILIKSFSRRHILLLSDMLVQNIHTIFHDSVEIHSFLKLITA